jgi:L-threonylcarbamoyladenylate synthase
MTEYRSDMARSRVTEVIRVDRQRPDARAISRAAECLRRGGLVAFPTETVYGLGAHALDRDAVQRLFAAKGRPSTDPLIVHVSRFDEMRTLAAGIPPIAATLAQRFWPGPLTLVVRRGASVPVEVTAGMDTVAVRVPSHPVAQALLAEAHLPIAAPSANLFSRPSPTRAAHVLADLDGLIDMVLDAGPADVGVESTVLDLTSVPPVVLRPGAVDVEALQDLIPDVQLRSPAIADPGVPLPSPGLLPQHYAPRTPMTLYPRATGPTDTFVAHVRDAVASGKRVGVLATVEDAAPLRHMPVVIAELGSITDVETVAARLYAGLRELDAAQLDVILVHDFSEDAGLWRALRDRLRRASHQPRTHP